MSLFFSKTILSRYHQPYRIWKKSNILQGLWPVCLHDGESKRQESRWPASNVLHLANCLHLPILCLHYQDCRTSFHEGQEALWTEVFCNFVQSVPDYFQSVGLQTRLEVRHHQKLSQSIHDVDSFYVSGDYSWKCEPVDYSQNPDALRALTMAYIFYISKIIDMIDSVIFLLKKKYTHLSFLHIFHHGIMPFYTWWGPR